MKAKRLKTLGFALLGGLALLFAGCGQQASPGTGGGGAVTSVGIQLPLPGPNGYGGTVNVDVTVNEGAQVKSIVLKVDGQQVNQINVTGLRPQALTYTLLLDTAQLDPATNQPRFRNGPHTLTVEVTDVNNNTKSASSTVTFFNQDRVRGLVVSQADNPKAPVTVSGVKWYGNGNVLVTVDIVNYSGATYTLSGSGFPFDLVASGGSGGSLSGYKVQNASTGGFSTPPAASPVSDQPQLELKKIPNSTFQASGKLEVFDGSNVVASVTFGLDNVAPSGTPALELKRFFEKNFAAPSGAYASGTLMRGTGASSDPTGLVYKAKFVATVGTEEYTFTLPAAISGVVSKGYNVTVSVEDGLGNASTTTGSATLTVDDRNFTIVAPSYTTTYNAGDNLNFTSSPGISGSASGTVTYVLALKDGNNYLPIISGPANFSNVLAVKGASYAIVAVDQAGNYAVLPLNITVNQVNADTTPPTVTIDSGLTYASTSVTGKASDNVAGPGYLVGYIETGKVGNDVFFRYLGESSFTAYPGSYPSHTFTTTPTPYTLSLDVPNYQATLALRVAGVDAASNLAVASGQVAP